MITQCITDIQKHNNKICRILNKISQKQPGLAQEIDLALYSSLKIQKIIKKFNEQSKIQGKSPEQEQFRHLESNVYQNQEDQLYQNAKNVIQGFKMATKTLQKKVGILLRQQQLIKIGQKNNIYHRSSTFYDMQTENKNTIYKKKNQKEAFENRSPFEGNPSSGKAKSHYIQSGSKDKSKRQKVRINEHGPEQISSENENKSKNISQLDQQIIELASELKHMIRGK